LAVQDNQIGNRGFKKNGADNQGQQKGQKETYPPTPGNRSEVDLPFLRFIHRAKPDPELTQKRGQHQGEREGNDKNGKDSGHEISKLPQ